MTYHFPGTKGVVESTISAQNTFTPSLETRGMFNFSVSGTFVGTITIQRSFDLVDSNGVWIPDNSKTWHDLETYTSPAEDIGIQPEEQLVVRAGIKTGDYTSGSATLRISR
ncbi:MAG: hypothetical protein V3V84_00700 [Candidatus Bathyarchaeia archaeon]